MGSELLSYRPCFALTASQHQFSVIRSAGQSGYNFVNPPRRDVVNIGDVNDNVTIRFVTDNVSAASLCLPTPLTEYPSKAGPWFLHWYAAGPLESSLSGC
jgi:hypothetical protein